jgi:hypothetical protein
VPFAGLEVEAGVIPPGALRVHDVNIGPRREGQQGQQLLDLERVQSTDAHGLPSDLAAVGIGANAQS